MPGYLWLFIMYERLTGFHHGTVIAMTMLIGNSRNGQPFLVEIYMLDICKHSPLREYSLFSLNPDFSTGNCEMQYFFYTPPPSSTHTLTHKVSNKDNDSAMTMSINYRKFVRQARKIIEFLRIKERKKF